MPVKCALIGSGGVGKTCLVNAFCDEDWNGHGGNPTIQEIRSLRYRVGGLNVMLDFWDTAGQEEFRSFIPEATAGCSCLFIVYSVSDRRTKESTKDWFDSHRPESELCGVVVVGTKSDLLESEPETVDTEPPEWISEFPEVQHCLVSARTGENVATLLHLAAKLAVQTVQAKEEAKMDALAEAASLGAFTVPVLLQSSTSRRAIEVSLVFDRKTFAIKSSKLLGRTVKYPHAVAESKEADGLDFILNSRDNRLLRIVRRRANMSLLIRCPDADARSNLQHIFEYVCKKLMRCQLTVKTEAFGDQSEEFFAVLFASAVPAKVSTKTLSAVRLVRDMAQRAEQKGTAAFTRLEMGGKLHSSAEIACVCSALVWNVSLESIDVSANRIDASGLKQLLAALRTHSQLRVLRLGSNPLGPKSGEPLGSFLLLASLTELSVARSGLSTPGAVFIVSAVANNQHLQVLDLSTNQIKHSSALSNFLANLLRRNSVLRQLDLSGNALTQDSVVAMCRGLQHNLSLQLLDLDRNPEIKDRLPLERAVQERAARAVRAEQGDSKAGAAAVAAEAESNQEAKSVSVSSAAEIKDQVKSVAALAAAAAPAVALLEVRVLDNCFSSKSAAPPSPSSLKFLAKTTSLELARSAGVAVPGSEADKKHHALQCKSAVEPVPLKLNLDGDAVLPRVLRQWPGLCGCHGCAGSR